MKFKMTKLASLTAAVFTAAVVAVGSPAMVFADEVDATIESQLQQTVKGLTDSIIAMSDEDIAKYKDSQDAFTVSAMESWESAKKEVGDRENPDAANASDIKVEFEDKVYTVSYDVEFSKEDATFIYAFDQSGTPTNMSIDVKVSLATNLQRAGLNTLMGVGIVFLVLVFLSFLISLFRFIPDPEKKKREAAKKAAEQAALEAAPMQTEVAEDYTDDEELVAVISAAIAASMGTTTDGFVVRSIRKARRAR